MEQAKREARSVTACSQPPTPYAESLLWRLRAMTRARPRRAALGGLQMQGLVMVAALGRAAEWAAAGGAMRRHREEDKEAEQVSRGGVQPQSLWGIPTAAVSSCRSWPHSCSPNGESRLQL